MALLLQLWLLPLVCALSIYGTSASTWRVPLVCSAVAAFVGLILCLLVMRNPHGGDGAIGDVAVLFLLIVTIAVTCLFSFGGWMVSRALDRGTVPD